MNDNHRDDDKDDELDGMIEIQSADEIPQFKTEAEEAEFWLTHSLASHFFTHRGPRAGSIVERLVRQRQQHTEAQKGH